MYMIVCPDNSTDQIVITSRYYSTGHGHCSTYTCLNCKQYGGFPWKIHAKNSHVNFYTTLSVQTFYMQIWVYFYGDWFCFWKYTQVACISLQQQMWLSCKIRNHIVEKHLFVVKEKTTYYTLSLNDHATIVNVMFCNQRFPWLLAEARM